MAEGESLLLLFDENSLEERWENIAFLKKNIKGQQPAKGDDTAELAEEAIHSS
jgi:hypothetical protein